MGCCKKNDVCCVETVRPCAGKQETQDYLICTCMGVMYSEICDAIDQGATSFEELSEQLGVGTGCSTCVQEVHDILKSKM